MATKKRMTDDQVRRLAKAVARGLRGSGQEAAVRRYAEAQMKGKPSQVQIRVECPECKEKTEATRVEERNAGTQFYCEFKCDCGYDFTLDIVPEKH